MKLSEPVLFVEINMNNFIFTVGKYDENQNFNIIETLATSSNEILNGNIVNIDYAKIKVKKNIEDLENKLKNKFQSEYDDKLEEEKEKTRTLKKEKQFQDERN